MVLSILKCSLSAEGAALLLPASLGAGLLFKLETALLVKRLKQANQAQACPSTSVIMKIKNIWISPFGFSPSYSVP